MKIYLARHGRTNYNDLNLCNGDPGVDVHITEVGVKQAPALSDKLREKPIDRIFVSEMPRTWQTAEIVNQFHRVTMETVSLLNDHRSGYAVIENISNEDAWTRESAQGDYLEFDIQSGQAVKKV